MDPTTERFRGLARSSPWRWSTLRYVQERDPSGRDRNRVRVWIRRPKLARVEQLDGTVLGVHRGEPQTVTPLSRRGNASPQALPGPSDVEVEIDDDGLVRHHPGRWQLDTDTVMIGNYYAWRSSIRSSSPTEATMAPEPRSRRRWTGGYCSRRCDELQRTSRGSLAFRPGYRNATARTTYHQQPHPWLAWRTANQLDLPTVELTRVERYRHWLVVGRRRGAGKAAGTRRSRMTSHACPQSTSGLPPCPYAFSPAALPRSPH